MVSQHLLYEKIANKKIKLAHRGYTKNYQENTLLACTSAINNNRIDGFEIDITITNDDILVLFHDSDLKRLFKNNKSKINDLNFSEVNNLFIKDDISIKKMYSRKTKICTLKRLIEFIDQIPKFNKIINIEFKYDKTDISKIKLLVNKTYILVKKYLNNIYFTSYNKLIVDYLVNNYKNDLMIGIIINEEEELCQYLKKEKELEILIINKNIRSTYFRQAIEKKYILGIYTYNSYYYQDSKNNINDIDKNIIKDNNIDIIIFDKLD
jgi:glycerophosphoryl diester phosphodiesterase